MRNLIGTQLAACLAITLLAACAPVASAPAGIVAASQQPAATQHLPTPPPTSEPLGAGIPAVQFHNGGNKLILVSALSGSLLDETGSISLGEFYAYAFAPDGRTLALVSAGQLYLIDLASWRTRTFDINAHGSLSDVTYSPDGSLLAIAGSEPNAVLTLVNAASGEVLVSVQADFAVHNIRFTTDGKALMIYGPQLATSGQEASAQVSVGSPRVELLSVSDLKTVWSAQVDGLRDGTFPKKPGTTDLFQPGAASHFSPAIVFAPGSDTLYAVHGDSEKLTVVDFDKRRVRTVAVRAKTGWFERLLSWTAGVAHAKGMDGTTKQAVISRDGKYLFVLGSTATVTQLTDGNWDFSFTPLGLQVIAAADGTLLQQIDSEAYMARLSPDGRHVLLQGWQQDSGSGAAWTDVYDIASQKIVKHIEGVQLIPARRLDGKLSLQSSVAVTNTECHNASLDAASWSTTASWKSVACPDWLAAP